MCKVKSGSIPHAVNEFQSKPHYYNGEHSSGGLSEFVHEILRPSVINLDTRMFKELVENKPEVIMCLALCILGLRKFDKVAELSFF